MEEQVQQVKVKIWGTRISLGHSRRATALLPKNFELSYKQSLPIPEPRHSDRKRSKLDHKVSVETCNVAAILPLPAFPPPQLPSISQATLSLPDCSDAKKFTTNYWKWIDYQRYFEIFSTVQMDNEILELSYPEANNDIGSNPAVTCVSQQLVQYLESPHGIFVPIIPREISCYAQPNELNIVSTAMISELNKMMHRKNLLVSQLRRDMLAHTTAEVQRNLDIQKDDAVVQRYNTRSSHDQQLCVGNASR